MSGSLIRGGGENVPGFTGACATRNFAYLVRGPWNPWGITIPCQTYVYHHYYDHDRDQHDDYQHDKDKNDHDDHDNDYIIIITNAISRETKKNDNNNNNNVRFTSDF